MYCYNCSNKISPEYKFCEFCGTNLKAQANTAREETAATQSASSLPEQVKGTFLQATEKVNQLVGEEGSIDVNLKEVFSAVFKKHTKEEGELLFISGTSLTSPEESEISTTWPRPWLFSRVFIALAITFAFLYISAVIFVNINALPGLIVIGSFMAPFSLLIFFWEMNAPRNISFYEVMKMFFVGGTASIVITLFLYSFFPVYDLNFTGAITVGIVEEVGKLVIIAYFIQKLNPKYILNGLLIGATIGSGFAAFESAGYAFTFGIAFGEQMMLSVIVMRAWMAIGTHVIWSAIAGAALVYVKGNTPLQSKHFQDNKFIRLFAVSVILHAVWDMPLTALHNFYLLFIILIVVAWIFIFSLISAGLKQIVRLNQE